MSDSPSRLSDTMILHDSSAARALDIRATALLGGDAYLLMQRAGLAAWEKLSALYPRARRIAVVCGTGNNGGDGYVVAKLAADARRQVRVVHLADHGPRSELAQRACTEYLTAGGRVELFPVTFEEDEIIVDALFGIGLSRPPSVELNALIAAMNAARCPVFALDVPSGIDADRGCVPGAAVRACHTMQFISRHKGLYTGDALDYTGELLFDSLDVPDAAFSGVEPAVIAMRADSLAGALPRRLRNGHKGDSGRVLCVGGEYGSGGAIMLCAEAALRVGAGLVSVATRAAHVPALLARRPEIMVRSVDDDPVALPGLEAADAVALGPGLGTNAWGQGLYQAILAARVPVVVDADGLNLLAAAPHAITHAVLTPHPGEAARLLGWTTEAVQQDRFAALGALIERYQATVILKGAGTLIGAPGRTPHLVRAGNPGFATGGMGDLLTGVVASLWAQGLDAWTAARIGALLHAAAGDIAVQDGELGMLPTDLLMPLRFLANFAGVSEPSP